MSLKKGLVLDLDISSEGLQGTTKFKDKTPYENNGTLSNVTLTTDHKGKANSAGLFNGTSSYIDCGNNESLNITGAITMSAWIKIDSYTDNNPNIIAKELSYFLGIGTTGNYIRSGIRTSEGSYEIKTATNNSIPLNTWTHILFCYSDIDNIFKQYVNGIKVEQGGDTTTKTLVISDKNVLIGSWKIAEQHFNGSIERPQLWNRALGDDEIKLLYESYNPSLHIDSLQKGLVGHWTMAQDSLKGSLLTDKTPYENDGTIYGATFTTDRMGQPNKAMSFDGTDDYIQADDVYCNSLNGMTWSAWVKFNEIKDCFILDQRELNIGYQPFYLASNGDIQFYNSILKNSTYFDTNLKTNQWYLLTATTENNLVKFYLNGSYFTSKEDISYDFGVKNLRLGSRHNNVSFLNGLIDDVRIYNRALSEEEITKLYESYNK